MKNRKSNIKNTPDNPELNLIKQGRDKYLLCLYITGSTIRSALALTNLQKICEAHLEGRYELEVINLYQQPELAQTEQIIAAPTLIKKSPLPLRRIIGDMSDIAKVLSGLGITAVKDFHI